MGSIYPGCEQSVKNQNPNDAVCSDQHCDSFTETQTYHDDCVKHGVPLFPVPTAQCYDPATKQYSEPVYVPNFGYSCPGGTFNQPCFCCCSCLANGTPIAIPEGLKPIEQFNIGDAITVGDRNGAKLSWKTGEVKFSSGTDPGGLSTMMFIAYGDKKKLVASIDHLFLLASGKLKRADRVVPGKDQLTSADGTPLDIHSSTSGKWSKGLHHVATGLRFEGTVDGHLINSAGVVSGDYCLQINQHELVKMGLMDAAETAPAHGTGAYAAANPHLHVTRAAAVKGGTDLAKIAAPAGFTPYDPDGGIYIPPGAAQFLTDAQAADIVANPKASFRDLHDDSGLGSMNYLIKVFKGFYPAIHILLDQANPNFNTYAFEMYGQKYLIISGEIMRLNGLYSEGYKFIISQGIARLLGEAPRDDAGFTYVAAADFYATSSIFRDVFYLDPNDLDNNALQQIQTVFGFISEANAAGDPDDLAHNPSIRCRIGSLNTGIFGGDVPGCACADLALQTVMVDSADATHLLLELVFNKAIDPASVKDLYNFKFSSTVAGATLPRVVLASVSTVAADVVMLAVEAPDDGEFTVTVTDVLSAGGSTLGSQDSATFTIAAPDKKVPS